MNSLSMAPMQEKQEINKSLFIDQLESKPHPHEMVRDIIHGVVRKNLEELKLKEFANSSPVAADINQIIQQKRDELYSILGVLDQKIKGKSPKEVAAFFSSLLDVHSQLCLQKTDGVIIVKIRLSDFFEAPKGKMISSILSQEISMIYTPEEVNAIRANMEAISEDNPLKPLFTTVLDQAHDSIQYNEITGFLLLEMTDYFLKRLASNGFADDAMFQEFNERHLRARKSLERSLDDLREMEAILTEHNTKYPVLKELPIYLRVLIQIKLGLVDKKYAPVFIQKVNACMVEYSRARGMVAFDFKRLPSVQYAVKRRQSIILNLQKDVLKFTGKMMESEFAAFQQDYERILAEIEINSASVEPGSREYKQMMLRKAEMQKEFERRRQQLDIVMSQETLVDVQHTLIKRALDRFERDGTIHHRIEEKIVKMQNIPVAPDKETVQEDSAQGKKNERFRTRFTR